MMSDRDNVIQISTKEVNGGTLLVGHTTEHPSMPPQPKVVRMYNYFLAFAKQDGENVTCVDF